MRHKGLGVVAALTLASVACAAVIVTRIHARGSAANEQNHQLNFQLSVLHIDNAGNERSVGQGSFAWSVNGRTQAMRIRTINSVSVEETAEARIVTVSGVGQLGRWGFMPSRYRNNLVRGDFSATFVDRYEGDDTVQFSFSSGSGLNAYHYHFS
ncbi:MAG: hypothetical protein ACK4UU_06975, partial [Fimbriimonadales bacterium]